MKRIRTFVSAKTLTPVECVKMSSGENYSDGIIKGFDYHDTTQITVSVTNLCSVPFDILGFELFSELSNGGDFRASVKDFPIGPNQTINIPVYYNGIFLGNNLNPNYQISLNSNYAIYSLVVSVSEVNNPPLAGDIEIELDNRQDRVLNINDFLNHFSDIDNDDLAAVIIEGNVQRYLLNNIPYIEGTQIPRSLIESGLLIFKAPDTSDYSEDATIWKAVDTAGSISN